MTALWLGAAGTALIDLVWQAALVAILVAGVLRGAGAALPQCRHVVTSGAIVVLAVGVLATMLAVSRVATTTSVTWGSGSAAATAGALIDPEWLVRIGAVWLAVVVISAIRLVAAVLGVAGLVRRARTVHDAALLEAFAQAMRSVGIARRVRLLEAPRLASPVTAGWLRPIVLVPVGFGRGLGPAHVRAILIHELVHVRRHDFAMGVVRRALGVLVGFHPAVAWLERRAAEACEEACDDATARLSDRLVYARALERLERQRCPDARTPAMVPAAAPTPDRILRLLLPVRPRRGRVALALALSAMVLVTLAGATPDRLDRQARWLAARTVPLVDIRARDPAGEFTLALREGRAVAATVAGRTVPRERLLQQGDRVRIPDPSGGPALEIRVKEGGRGISWQARMPSQQP